MLKKKVLLAAVLLVFGLTIVHAQNLPVGANSGWPSASILNQVRLPTLPSLRQHNGISVSYDFDNQNGLLIIYLANGTQRTIDELAQAIEAATHSIGGGSSQAGLYTLSFTAPASRGFDVYRVEIELKRGGVQLTARADE